MVFFFDSGKKGLSQGFTSKTIYGPIFIFGRRRAGVLLVSGIYQLLLYAELLRLVYILWGGWVVLFSCQRTWLSSTHIMVSRRIRSLERGPHLHAPVHPAPWGFSSFLPPSLSPDCVLTLSHYALWQEPVLTAVWLSRRSGHNCTGTLNWSGKWPTAIY